MIRFIPFTSVLGKCKQSCLGFELRSACLFPTTISITPRVDMYVRVYCLYRHQIFVGWCFVAYQPLWVIQCQILYIEIEGKNSCREYRIDSEY